MVVTGLSSRGPWSWKSLIERPVRLVGGGLGGVRRPPESCGTLNALGIRGVL